MLQRIRQQAKRLPSWIKPRRSLRNNHIARASFVSFAGNFLPVKVVQSVNTSLLSQTKIKMAFRTGDKKFTRTAIAGMKKEEILNMDIDDKRKLYKCGSKYMTLKDIPTWPEYFGGHTSKKKNVQPKYSVNKSLNEKISIWRGDITRLEIDAICNAANNSLLGGGGVDGAIHAAAGSALRTECATLNGCETGDAKITGGYKLPARYIIHTVGPIGKQERKLRSCYSKCLQLVQEEQLKSVAFPCISTGIYGYPNEDAAHVALDETRQWLETDDNADNVERIVFCLFMAVDVELYPELLQVYFPLTAGKQKDGKGADSTAKKAEKDEKEEKGGKNKEEDKEESIEKVEVDQVKSEPREQGDGNEDASVDSKPPPSSHPVVKSEDKEQHEEKMETSEGEAETITDTVKVKEEILVTEEGDQGKETKCEAAKDDTTKEVKSKSEKSDKGKNVKSEENMDDRGSSPTTKSPATKKKKVPTATLR